MGDSGILVNQMGFARILNNTIRNNKFAGITVGEGGAARIGFLSGDDTTPSPNTIVANGGDGIRVFRSSTARIVGNTISGNQGHGLSVSKASQADIALNTIDGNVGDGINVSEGSGANLGNANGTTMFDLPNETTANNEGFGIGYSIGGYVSGRLGKLAGSAGVKNFTDPRGAQVPPGVPFRTTCVDNLTQE